MEILKTNTQTVTLDGSEQEVRFNRNYPYFWVQNQGDSDVLISINSGIAEGKDGVMTILGGGGTGCTMHGYDLDRFYLLGSGKVQVVGTYSAHCPFKAAQGGGDKYTLPVATTDILGGVKVDGTTITANADGVISAVASGGSPKITKLLSITKTQTESIAYTPNSPYTNYKYLIIKIDNNNKNTTTGMMIFERTAFTVGQSKTFPFVYDETAKQCYYYITFLANGNITIGANVTSCTIWGSNDIFTEI